jgi:MFS family permease
MPASAERVVIPRVIKRNTLLLAGTQAFVGGGNQLVPALGALIVSQLLGNPALAGLATAMLGACRFLVAYPAGYVADAYGRKTSLRAGMMLGIIGSITVGLAVARGSFPGFVVGIGLFGMGVGIAQQLRLAAADMYPPSRRAEGLGMVLMGSLLGAIGGPILVSIGEVSSRALALSPLALTWFLVPLALVPSLWLVQLIRPDPKEIAANLSSYYPGYVARKSTADATRLRVQDLLRSYPQRVALVSSFTVHGNMSLIMAMTSLALARNGSPLPAISLAVAIHVMGMYGFSLPLGRLADRLGRRSILLSATVIACAGSCLVSVSAGYVAVTFGTFLVGVGWSCMNVAAVAVLADTSRPTERGRVIGVNDTFSALSSVAMPLIGGPLVAIAGMGVLAPVCICLLVVPFALVLKLREPRPGEYGAPFAAETVQSRSSTPQRRAASRISGSSSTRSLPPS